MATVTFFTRVTNPDKKVNVRVRFRHGKKINLYAKSGLEVLPHQFSNNTQTINERVNYKGKASDRKYLNELKETIEEAYKEIKDIPTSNWLNEVIDRKRFPDKYKEKSITLFRFIQDFIDKAPQRILKSGHVAAVRTIQDYKKTFENIKDFAKYEKKNEYDFKDINKKFYDRYITYLTFKEKLAKNTIGKKVKILKIFLNAATPEYISSDRYKDFTTLTEDSKNIYLSEDELQDLYDLDLTGEPRLERVRDLFLIGAWTGLRYSDWNKIIPENIKDGYIQIYQSKTGKEVTAPIFPITETLLKKYNNNLHKIISNQKFNEYIQEVGKLAKFKEAISTQITRAGITETDFKKKWEMVSTHTARRSFATNMYRLGFSTIEIMSATGHQKESDLLGYIKVSPEDHAKNMSAHMKKREQEKKIEHYKKQIKVAK